MVSKMSHIAIEYGKGNDKLYLEQDVVEKWLKNFECLKRFQFSKKQLVWVLAIFCLSTFLKQTAWRSKEGKSGDLTFLDYINKLSSHLNLLCLAKVGHIGRGKRRVWLFIILDSSCSLVPGRSLYAFNSDLLPYLSFFLLPLGVITGLMSLACYHTVFYCFSTFWLCKLPLYQALLKFPNLIIPAISY